MSATYLLLYNFLQSAGWSYVGLVACARLIAPDAPVYLFTRVGFSLRLFQTLALLEVVHAAKGLVPSNPLVVLPQIASRVFLVWPILAFDEARITVGFQMLFTAWTITEIIRYTYYALSIVDVKIPILTYLRYSTFILLYPIGVTGELLCIYQVMKYCRSTGDWSYPLPNKFNASFQFEIFLAFVCLCYVFIFPGLYMHMFAQRSKALNPRKSS